MCKSILFYFIYVNIDGCIYTATPIDPLFLIASIIETHHNFESKDQLLYVSDNINFNKCDKCDLEVICDIQEVGDETFYKFSQDKWMTFLKMKFNGLMNIFKEKQQKKNPDTPKELSEGILY